MINFLAERGVPFTQKEPMVDPEAEDELAALGLYSTPVTRIGNEVVVGYDPDRLAELLGPQDSID